MRTPVRLGIGPCPGPPCGTRSRACRGGVSRAGRGRPAVPGQAWRAAPMTRGSSRRRPRSWKWSILGSTARLWSGRSPALLWNRSPSRSHGMQPRSSPTPVSTATSPPSTPCSAPPRWPRPAPSPSSLPITRTSPRCAPDASPSSKSDCNRREAAGTPGINPRLGGGLSGVGAGVGAWRVRARQRCGSGGTRRRSRTRSRCRTADGSCDLGLSSRPSRPRPFLRCFRAASPPLVPLPGRPRASR